jgi:hypothetical protein
LNYVFARSQALLHLAFAQAQRAFATCANPRSIASYRLSPWIRRVTSRSEADKLKYGIDLE